VFDVIVDIYLKCVHYQRSVASC